MVAGPDVAAELTVEALQRELAAARIERDAAQAREAALAEVLQAINASAGDMNPVFALIADKAMTMCDADGADLLAIKDGVATALALANPTPAQLEFWSKPFDLRQGATQLESRPRTYHIVDLADTDLYEKRLPLPVMGVEGGGMRTLVHVPLLGAGGLIGQFALFRRTVRPFSARQIALVEAFAAQAALALENARLFTELREALEQQTASAGVLRVISQSPTSVQPVFDAIAESALRLLNGWGVIVWRYESGRLQFGAARGGPAGSNEALPGMLKALSVDDIFVGEALRSGIVKQIVDVETEPVDPALRDLARMRGWRSNLAVPMVREGQPVGVFTLSRVEPGTFSEREVRLMQTFAAQAVIAIENVRLFTELRESLDQQTATAEILRAISQSPTDIAPVMTAVAKAAVRFCGAEDAHVFLRDGNELVSSAHEGPLSSHPLGYRDPLDAGNTARAHCVVAAQVTHLPDTLAPEAETAYRSMRVNSIQHGFRAQLNAPLLQGDRAIGCICLRRREPGAFTARQIELLQTFAAQAVIAIENVRLFTELRDSLEQQTATTEVLRVISQSPTEVQPVLEAVAKAAQRFCGAADVSIALRDGDEMHYATHVGPFPATVERTALDPSRSSGRAILEGRTIHLHDIQSLDPVEFAGARRLSAQVGFQSSVAAPMMRESSAIGCVLLRKPEPTPFTPRQIELLETFAAQAVIAIENVRLFTELRDSLERLKAAQANLIQSEKMASLGQLTAGIAHEIKNPLNFVNNFASLSVELLGELKEIAGPALATLDGERRAELDETMSLLTGNLDKIAEHGKRADGIVKSMLSHSRGGSGDWQASDINALVDETLNLAYHGARAQDKEFNVTLERDFAATAGPIEVVPQDVTRVFLNLFGNAFYATNRRRVGGREAGFRALIKVSTRDLGDTVVVTVRDNGTGIAPEMRDKLFQPFFTTKPTGEGTGLGLSISYDIVTQQHGGTIAVDSEPGQYTEFTVRLPRSRRSSRSEQA